MSLLPGFEGEERSVELSQWPTPPETAMRIAVFAGNAFADDFRPSILEPSCGKGQLVRAVLGQWPSARLTGIDIDKGNVDHCRRRFEKFDATFVARDFLEWTRPAEMFDVAILNPPFEGGQTERHILHALEHASLVVCHCPLTTLAGQERRAGLWSRASLEALAICSTRPKYGAEGGKTDMCTVMMHSAQVDPGRRCRANVEWWP